MIVNETVDESIQVLLLEDDADDYRLIARQLRNHQRDFVVDWAETLASAIEKLNCHPYDVVLSDLAVPDSFGPSTVAELRKHCGQTPIIVLTSLDDDRVDQVVLASGAQDYLVKEDLLGRAAGRAIVHAVKRQQATSEVSKLVKELEKSQEMLEEQASLLKKKNRRLRKLYRTAQEFVDNVSHDLRTPLAVIMDYTAIICEGMVGDVNDEQRAMLGKVGVRADDLNNMVDDLLDASKLESGLLGAWRRAVSVDDMLGRAESMLRQRAAVKGVELVVDRVTDLPAVYCDEEKVGRIITNLAVNGIKFAGQQGKVHLWARADPLSHQVVIGVTDSGPGIEKEAIEEIFVRFKQQRLDRTTGRGFGLGLNIAQKLCEINLGELDVESEIGVGSTFSFTLPVNDPLTIMERWLETAGKSCSWLRLVEIAIADDVTDASANELDSFLNCLLRRKDLLFRTSSSRWVCILAVSPSETQSWQHRAAAEFEKANRNRPFGPLPDFHTNVRYEWTREDSTSSILTELEVMLAETELVAN